MQYILVSTHLNRISVGEIDLTQFQLYKTIHKSRLDTSIVYLNSILAIHFNVGSCRRTRRLVPFLYHTSSIGVFVHYLSEKECCRPALVFMSNCFYVRSFYFPSPNLHSINRLCQTPKRQQFVNINVIYAIRILVPILFYKLILIVFIWKWNLIVNFVIIKVQIKAISKNTSIQYIWN